MKVNVPNDTHLEPCRGSVIEKVNGKRVRKKCNHRPEFFKINGLYYARCTHCTKWDPCEFLGVSLKTAIDRWNENNSKDVIKNKENYYD